MLSTIFFEESNRMSGLKVGLEIFWRGSHETLIFCSEWLFVRARTDRIQAIRMAYDHVTYSTVVSRENLR